MIQDFILLPISRHINAEAKTVNNNEVNGMAEALTMIKRENFINSDLDKVDNA